MSAADVIGILSFALHAAHKVYDLYQMFKDAPDGLRTLHHEARLLREAEPILRKLDADYEQNHATHGGSSDSTLHGHWKRLFEDAEGLHQGTEALVKKVTRDGDIGTWQKVKWVWYAKDGEELTMKFREFRESVNHTCGLISACVVFLCM